MPLPPGFDGAVDALKGIFADSVCGAFFTGGCLFVIALIIAVFIVDRRNPKDADPSDIKSEETEQRSRAPPLGPPALALDLEYVYYNKNNDNYLIQLKIKDYSSLNVPPRSIEL